MPQKIVSTTDEATYRTDMFLPLLLRLQRPIALVGMMGAGKTTVARQLSTITGLQYIDIDHQIERLVGCTIPHYFADYGEVAFRQKEAEVVQDYLGRGSEILALGGGAFIQNHLREVLLQRAWCIYLDVPLETLWQRVKHRQSSRPMIQGQQASDAYNHFAALYAKRAPIYAEASIVIACQNESSVDVAQKIKHTLWDFLQHQGDVQQGDSQPSPLSSSSPLS